jgi:hypothetical protein
MKAPGGPEQAVGTDYIPIEAAARRSGLHVNSLKRLLRQGAISGYKIKYQGRHRWMVSVRSLDYYVDPDTGFMLDRPGPKIFLRRREEQ